MASVLLGVTIFGINFTNHSVKAATTESVEKSKQPSTVVLPTAEQTKGINAIGAVKVPSLTDSQKAANKDIDDALNGIPVKSNSVDNQDNSATNAGDSSQTDHIQSESTGNVTNPSAQQAAGSVKDQLPQTGDETQRGAGLVGLALAGLVGLLGSAGFRKKRD